MGRQQSKSCTQGPGRSLVAQRWKFLLGILVVTAKMNLVSSEGSEAAVIPSLQHEDEQHSLDFLVNLPEAWGEVDYDDLGTESLESDTLPRPPLPMRMKKHLGSVAAGSGLRLPLLQELGMRSSAYQRGPVFSFKRREPLPIHKLFGGRRFGKKNDNLDGKIFREEEEDEVFYDRPLSPGGGEGVEEESPLRGKRFMGSLARGGWFPREFRGFVSPPQWDKRHVGSFARLGWMPHSSKFTRLAEQNFKRNLGSLRKNQRLRKDNMEDSWNVLGEDN